MAPSATDTEEVQPMFRPEGVIPTRPSLPCRARLSAAGPQSPPALPGGHAGLPRHGPSLQLPTSALLPRHSRLELAVLSERFGDCTHEPGRTNALGTIGCASQNLWRRSGRSRASD